MTKTGPNRPLNYHHNWGWLKGDIGNLTDIDVLKEGLFARAQLDVQHPNFPFVWQQVLDELLGFSGETIPTEGYLKANPDGWVEKFWIFGAAISPGASAPNRLTSVSALRAMGLQVDGEDTQEFELALRGVWNFNFPQASNPNDRAGGASYNSIPQENRIPRVTLPPTPQQVPNLRGGVSNAIVDNEVDGPPLRDILAHLSIGRRVNAFSPMQVQPTPEFLRGVGGRVAQLLGKDFTSSKPTFLRADVDAGTKSDMEIFADAVGVGVGKDPYLRANELTTSSASGFGSDWVHTAFSLVIWRDILLASRVAGLLESFNMPSNPFDYDVVGAGPTVRRLSQNANQSAQSWTASPYTLTRMATSKKTFNVLDRFGAAGMWTFEFQNYSQIDKVAAFTQSFVDQMAIAADRMLLHGDENATVTNYGHYGVDPTGTNYDAQLLVAGLRYHCLVTVAAQSASFAGAAITLAGINALRSRMGVLGVNPEDVLLFGDIYLFFTLLNMTELKTLDVYGPNATVLSGEVGKVSGMPFIPSAEMERANASGQLPSAHNGTLSNLLGVHKRAVKLGRLVDMVIKMFEVDASDAVGLKAYAGMDMQIFQNTAVSYTYNIL